MFGKRKEKAGEFGVYSIRDTIAEEFGPIFTAKNEGVAIRSFFQLLKGDPATNQADYTLHRLGTWDRDTGKLIAQDPTLIPVQFPEVK